MVLDMGCAHGLLLLPSLPAVLSPGGDKGMCTAENTACWKMGARGHLMENRSRLTGGPGRSSAYILGEACIHRKAVASRSRSRLAFFKICVSSQNKKVPLKFQETECGALRTTC